MLSICILKRTIQCLSLLAVFANPAYAWNESGHRQIAYLSYELVSESTRNKVVAIAKTHPRYQEDFLAEVPKGFSTMQAEDQTRWIFSQLAVWPDHVRGLADDLQAQHHRDTWHYINLPIYLSAEQAAALRGSMKVNLGDKANGFSDEDNIAQVLKQILISLNNPEAKLLEAVQLAWLFHLVGDVHQPTHSSAVFTPKQFPDGDWGGNKIAVGRYNLHSTWDWALGGENKPRKLKNTARKLVENPVTGEVGKWAQANLQIDQWVLESHSIAKQLVYQYPINNSQESLLDRIAAFEDKDPGELRVKLDKGYRTAMKKAARQRMIESAYRLAAVLDTYLQ